MAFMIQETNRIHHIISNYVSSLKQSSYHIKLCVTSYHIKLCVEPETVTSYHIKLCVEVREVHNLNSFILKIDFIPFRSFLPSPSTKTSKFATIPLISVMVWTVSARSLFLITSYKIYPLYPLHPTFTLPFITTM